MTEFFIENYTRIAIFASSFLMSSFLLFLCERRLKKIDEKYTYINEVFKQYLERQDDAE